jgi:thymidylate synthase
MQPYIDLLNDVLRNGVEKSDRTGTGTYSVFGRMLRVDIADGFPLLTTKKVHFRSIAHELLWFLKGTDDTAYLEQNKVTIWNEWETPVTDSSGKSHNSVGPMYGVNWIRFPNPDGPSVNQIDSLIAEIRRRPDSRRLIVSAWNPATLPDSSKTPHDNVRDGRGALAPCHAFFQFAVSEGRLSCMLTQRSADLFLGVPFNIASYALLVMMIAQQTDLLPGELIWSGGDVHIYKNHIDQVRLQLSRQPRKLPVLKIKRKPPSIYDYTIEDFEIEDYNPHPPIKAEVSV